MKRFVFEVFLEELIVHCNALQDKSGSIELTRLLKIRPCTKHINIMFHHFRDYVRKGLIHIQQVSTN